MKKNFYINTRIFNGTVAVFALGLTVFSAQGQTTFFDDLNHSDHTTTAQYGGQNDVNASDFTTGATAEIITNSVLAFANSDDINHVMTPKIYTDSTGKPGTLVGTLTSFTVPGSESTAGTFTYANYTATSASGIELQPDTTYWLVVSVDNATDLPFPVVWDSTASQSEAPGMPFSTVSSTDIKFSTDGGISWANAGNFPAGNTLFSLSGIPAPEPGSVPLALTAISCLWGGRLIFRRNKN